MCVCLPAQDSQDTRGTSWRMGHQHRPPAAHFRSQGSCLSCAYSGNSLKLHSCRRCCHCFGLLQFFRTVWVPKVFYCSCTRTQFSCNLSCIFFLSGYERTTQRLASPRKCCTSFGRDTAVGRCLPF